MSQTEIPNSPNKKAKVNQASMTLWIEGAWGEESIGWHEEFTFDFDRFQADDRFAHLLSTYVSQALSHLGDELEALMMVIPLPSELEHIEACMD